MPNRRVMQLDRVLQSFDRLFHLIQGELSFETHRSCQQNIVRAELHGEQAINTFNCRVGSDDGAKVQYLIAINALTHKKPAAFPCQHDCCADQYQSDDN